MGETTLYYVFILSSSFYDLPLEEKEKYLGVQLPNRIRRDFYNLSLENQDNNLGSMDTNI